jgi:hypothetical protein
MTEQQDARPDRVQQGRKHVANMRKLGAAKTDAEYKQQAKEARNGA